MGSRRAVALHAALLSWLCTQVLLGGGGGEAWAQEVESAQRLDPYAAQALHLGGAARLQVSQESIDGVDAETLVVFGFEGEAGYVLVDGLKLSGMPSFTVSAQGDVTMLMVGAALGLTYYLDCGGWAPFVRAQGGVVFGHRVQGDVTARLKGFGAGAGLGLSLALTGALVEVGADYQGTFFDQESTGLRYDVDKHALLIRVAYVLVF